MRLLRATVTDLCNQLHVSFHSISAIWYVLIQSDLRREHTCSITVKSSGLVFPCPGCLHCCLSTYRQAAEDRVSRAELKYGSLIAGLARLLLSDDLKDEQVTTRSALSFRGQCHI